MTALFNNFKSFRSLFLILVLPLITQCLEAEKPKRVYRFDFENEQQAKQVLSDLSVTCENPSECPESSGGLFFVETSRSLFSMSYSGGVCSQTLIAPNKVLTNRHCLPANALTKGSSCSNLTVFFPGTATKRPEKIACKSVVDLSLNYTETEAYHPDWAVLELVSDSTRQPEVVNTEGIPHNSSVVAYPVYYDRRDFQHYTNNVTFKITGKIKKISCQTKMDTYYSGYYLHPQNPLFSMVCDKEVIPGNSGTSLRAQNNQVLGAISMAVVRNQFIRSFGRGVSLENKYAGGTNAHCISHLNRNANETCFFDDKDETRAAIGTILPVIFAQSASADEQLKYNDMLDADANVQWEDHNKEFIQSILKGESFAQYANFLTPAVAQFVEAHDSQVRFPKTPLCIYASKKDQGEFNFILPAFYARYSDIVLRKTGLFEAPLIAQKLIFTARYNRLENNFQARLMRLEDSQRRDYLNLRDRISDEFGNCYQSSLSYDCSRLKTEEDRQLQFFGVLGETGATYFNEDFIDGNSAGTNTVSIPVCD